MCVNWEGTEGILGYDSVKAAVKAYEMVPEAYCHRFRKRKKGDKMASGVKTFEDLCDLLLLEQFKNAVPNRIGTQQLVRWLH